MVNEAILLPGQGAQHEGMGRDWADAFPIARDTWREADEVLGFALTEACWSSGDAVDKTDVAQPGIYTTGVAILRVLEAHGLDLAAAPFVAGLSLGEYTAHWCAGTFSFADGLRLVRLRGRAMQAASDARPSGMASLTGATIEQAEALAKVGAEHGICQVANLNAPGQIVLSGDLAALDAVEAAARDHGVRRVRRIVVAGGFHSECMRPAADELAAALADVALTAPRVPVISNVTAEPVTSVGEVRRTLAAQICAPVLWERSMRAGIARGVTRFLEPGPGTVLAGLLSRIDPSAVVRSMARPADLGAPAGGGEAAGARVEAPGGPGYSRPAGAGDPPRDAPRRSTSTALTPDATRPLAGKVALVTGASRGIGRAVAVRLARDGARVACVATRAENAEGTAAACAEWTEGARAFGVDVSDTGAVAALTEEIRKELGGLDVLVNNAGITRDQLLLRMGEEDFDRVVAVNLKGTWNFLKAAVRPMMKTSGRIVNIASVVGLTGNAGQANYAASKAGVLGLTRSAAKELAGRGVCVNAIAPGFIETDMTAGIPENERERLKGAIPLGRLGSADDIAEAVAYLAGPAGGYITGQTLVVDGGLSL